VVYFTPMAQVTLYLPDKTAARLKKAATKSGQSVSAFVTALAERELSSATWPSSFDRLYGGWEGDFIIGPDAPPDPVELP
jgi:Ribbon-helix-helix protein, copG family